MSAVPTGLGSSLGIHPALTCRANECRRFAAGILRSIRYCLSCEIFLGNFFFRLFFFGKTLRAELQEQGRAASGYGVFFDGKQDSGLVLDGAAEAEPCRERDAAGGLRRQVSEIEDNEAEASAFEQQVGGAENLFEAALGIVGILWFIILFKRFFLCAAVSPW